jgi:fructose-bisphosphate aldolase, class I
MQMDISLMKKTATAMVAPGKGLLAADESASTCAKRFEAANVPDNVEMRRKYREMLFTTAGIADTLSGVILHDETLRQSTSKGVPFAKHLSDMGIIPGIKVDGGTKPLALTDGELVTEGLDGLRARLQEYFKMGARFAKWRAVVEIGENKPTVRSIWANMHAMARYAALCQEASIVPIVEPEILLDGTHDIDTCFRITEVALRTMFAQLSDNHVMPECTILKASMVISGKDAKNRAGVQEVAQKTVQVLSRTAPAALPGIVFLSGGQSDYESTAHLNAMNNLAGNAWPLTYSYSRALHYSALKVWRGKDENVAAAQATFAARANACSLAARGLWNDSIKG